MSDIILRKILEALQSGGTGGGSYTNPDATPTTIGGIPSGSTFDSVSFSDMWDQLLYPYQAPSFTSFSISGVGTTFEVGDTLPADSTFLWGTSNSGNVQADSIDIRDVTNGVDLATGTANDGSEATSHAAITKTSATSHVFRISGVNTQSGTFTRNSTHSWRWRLFYGESVATPLDEAGIEGLRASMLASGFARTYNFLAGGYKYLCYPASFGTATSFTDTSTMLSVPFQGPYLVSVTNSFGQTTNYRVHRSSNILGGSISIAVS